MTTILQIKHNNQIIGLCDNITYSETDIDRKYGRYYNFKNHSQSIIECIIPKIILNIPDVTKCYSLIQSPFSIIEMDQKIHIKIFENVMIITMGETYHDNHTLLINNVYAQVAYILDERTLKLKAFL